MLSRRAGSQGLLAEGDLLVNFGRQEVKQGHTVAEENSMQFADHDVVQERKVSLLSFDVRVLVIRSGHWLRKKGHNALVERTRQLIHYIRDFGLLDVSKHNMWGMGRKTRTCSRCINKLMNDIKSTISVGSKCASKSDISVGMKSITLDPVVATMRANANRVYERSAL